MLSEKPVEIPQRLMALAQGGAPIRALVAGADTAVALESARQASDARLIEPVLIGAPDRIAEQAAKIGWDIGGLDQLSADGDAEIAYATAVAAADTSVGMVMKGHVHTDALMGALLKPASKLHVGRRLTHVFHMTIPGGDKALMISDGALNIAPTLKTKQAIVENLVELSHALGIDRPRIALLSASEEVMEGMPSTVDAATLKEWAAAKGFKADISGPFAFDNAVSPAAAAIKGLSGDPVAGQADALVVSSIEVGNALFKMMAFFMSACAAGVVLGGRIPVIITSRADPPAARVASAALAAIAARM